MFQRMILMFTVMFTLLLLSVASLNFFDNDIAQAVGNRSELTVDSVNQSFPRPSNMLQTRTISDTEQAQLDSSIVEQSNSVVLSVANTPTVTAKSPESFFSAMTEPFTKTGYVTSGPMAASTSGAINLALDDGTAERRIGLTDGGQFLWLNRFTPAAGDFPFTLNEIQVFFGGGVNVGEVIDLYVYEDTDGDGNPSTRAVLVGSAISQTVQVLNSFSRYPVNIELNGPGDVLIGVVNRTAGTDAKEFPAALDETTSQGRSWIGTYPDGNPPDSPTLPAPTWRTTDQIDRAGNWMIRGIGTSTPIILYNNGPLVNSLGTGAGRADESMRQSTTLNMKAPGFDHQALLNRRIADDFTVTAPSGWRVETITFYAYQTISPTIPLTSSTITAVNYRIWNGRPNDAGSSVIFGDTTTNRLVNSRWSDIYRVSDNSPGNIQRPIMANTVSVGTHLPPGTYWLDWQADGSRNYSGPWAPPITINGQSTTGNALLFNNEWDTVLDSGTETPQGFPFIIKGSVVGADGGHGTCKTYNSTDVPQNIGPDAGSQTFSQLNIPDSGTLIDLNVVNLAGTHTFIRNLDFNLISPKGTEVKSMAPNCGNQDNFNLNLDDEVPLGLWPCPPTDGGTYPPSNSLTSFDNDEIQGTWTLRVDDNVSQDGGQLNSWGLEVCYLPGTSGSLYLPLVLWQPRQISTPTPTPTLTPMPSSVTNSGFETGDFTGWTTGGDGKLAQKISISSNEKHSGSFAALLGDPTLGDGSHGNIPTKSAYIEQVVNVPASGARQLSFWYRMVTYDVIIGGESGRIFDSFDVTINNTQVHRDGNPNSNGQGSEYDTGWKQQTIDLSAYSGPVTLRFAIFNREYDNNGIDFYNTWVYIDDVIISP